MSAPLQCQEQNSNPWLRRRPARHLRAGAEPARGLAIRPRASGRRRECVFPRGQKRFSQRTVGAAEGDGVESRAVAAREAQPDVDFADDVGKQDLRVGDNDDRFGVARTVGTG